ncbi:hypothetical protein J3R30DRAFT_1736831 [Lentinula aciculospora]|uniref:Uncharacterized protein n=1 Tax=Lentinula aciculospora TaxID=153920 RepID=A0A9W9DFC0_9AGAR|nr:hypothetical protein J3R30DRAFT_1736831 [Lentinula aciculospora]
MSSGEDYEYVAINRDIGGALSSSASTIPTRGLGTEAESRSKRKPGTFHDRETCPGCVARERVLLATRKEIQANAEEEEPIDDLPPYVHSAQTIPPCNGIRDVLITGSTDPRHAAAWGKWIWRGRVRKWDGLVGLVRSVDSGVSTNFSLF